MGRTLATELVYGVLEQAFNGLQFKQSIEPGQFQEGAHADVSICGGLCCHCERLLRFTKAVAKQLDPDMRGFFRPVKVECTAVFLFEAEPSIFLR